MSLSRILCLSCIAALPGQQVLAKPRLAPVEIYAQSFISANPIQGAKVTVLETQQSFTTDKAGHIGPLQYPVGKPITLELESPGFTTTQTGTTLVPAQGLVGPYQQMTLQVPSTWGYHLLVNLVGAEVESGYCHVAATITAYHKTLHDIPQGIDGIKAKLSPNPQQLQPFYFGIFKSGLLKGKTNPMARGLSGTSEDGGVAYFNLPPSDKPYTLTAEKAGYQFSSAKFICRKDAFINISPPQGPTASKDAAHGIPKT